METKIELIKQIDLVDLDGYSLGAFLAAFAVSAKIKEKYLDISIDFRNAMGEVAILGERELSKEEIAAQSVSRAESIEALEYRRYLELKEKYEGGKDEKGAGHTKEVQSVGP